MFYLVSHVFSNEMNGCLFHFFIFGAVSFIFCRLLLFFDNLLFSNTFSQFPVVIWFPLIFGSFLLFSIDSRLFCLFSCLLISYFLFLKVLFYSFILLVHSLRRFWHIFPFGWWNYQYITYNIEIMVSSSFFPWTFFQLHDFLIHRIFFPKKIAVLWYCLRCYRTHLKSKTFLFPQQRIFSVIGWISGNRNFCLNFFQIVFYLSLDIK